MGEEWLSSWYGFYEIKTSKQFNKLHRLENSTNNALGYIQMSKLLGSIYKGQGKSLKSTGPPRPASASRRLMITAIAASSLLGLLEPWSLSIISMPIWEFSPAKKSEMVRMKKELNIVYFERGGESNFLLFPCSSSPFVPYILLIPQEYAFNGLKQDWQILYKDADCWKYMGMLRLMAERNAQANDELLATTPVIAVQMKQRVIVSYQYIQHGPILNPEIGAISKDLYTNLEKKPGFAKHWVS